MGRHLPRSSKWACRSAPVDEMLVDLGTSLRWSLSGLCERDNVLTAHAAAQDLENGVAGRSIERGGGGGGGGAACGGVW